MIAVGKLRIAAAKPATRRRQPGDRGQRAVVVGGRLKAAPAPALVVAGPGSGDADV